MGGHSDGKELSYNVKTGSLSAVGAGGSICLKGDFGLFIGGNIRRHSCAGM